MNRLSVDPAGPEEPMYSAPEIGEQAFSFAGFLLEPDGTLFRGGSLVHLPPKELAALRLLLAHAGQIVTPQEMRQALWGAIHVSPDSVTKCVSSLRARLELEDAIQTIYKRGYRFSANVVSRPAAPAGPRARLAIAPFSTSPGVPGYLGCAVAEETAAGLTRARHPRLAVLAQDSVFTLARRGLMAQQIGEALKADFVLTGSLRALPSQYRLGVEMIRVRDGVQVWAEDVLVSRSRAAAVETELAGRLNFRLNASLPTGFPFAEAPPGEGLSLAAAAEPAAPAGGIDESERRLQAYEVFQSAHQQWRTHNRTQLQESVELLLRAIDLDPSLTGARVDLVNLCIAQAIYGFQTPDVAMATARRAAEPLTDPAGQAAAILPALGWISFHYDRDLAAALRAFAQSAHLPHDPWTTRARSFFALSRHRFGQAIGLLRDALALDPHSPWLHGRLAWALHLAGETEESLRQAQHAIAQFPDDATPGFYGSMILACHGDPWRAAAVAQELEARVPHLDVAIAAHAYALARTGQADEARAALEQLEWRARERFTITGFNAAVYLELGAPDQAIKVLRDSMENRCPWFFQMLADPRLKALHGHPAFERMRGVLAQMEERAARPE